MTHAAKSASAPRFEIVREADMPRPQKSSAPSMIEAAFGAIRSVIEGGYVWLARGIMVRGEHLEDARAASNHGKRARRAERQRLRQQRRETPVTSAARAPTGRERAS